MALTLPFRPDDLLTLVSLLTKLLDDFDLKFLSAHLDSIRDFQSKLLFNLRLFNHQLLVVHDHKKYKRLVFLYNLRSSIFFTSSYIFSGLLTFFRALQEDASSKSRDIPDLRNLHKDVHASSAMIDPITRNEDFSG
ncbi:hypothetical protein RclHR1_06890012 [Rhizophagus clarus]|uniref:Uncharacterized protein n=1 Tax=Rhizophagus clarus TaxID=94130 RepID=A0A2Z6RTT8_9GLOM|nr:hypothetical protein RclHR1_06890012 [Rhizophagus clarus]GET03149.1 hypothetical protein RCL_e23926_RclHR1_06890012 [Rhizophagus clarus]